MVRFVMGCPYVLKADHLQRCQEIVSMQPAMLIGHSAAKSLVVLGVYIALPIGAHVNPMKLMSFSDLVEHLPSRVGGGGDGQRQS